MNNEKIKDNARIASDLEQTYHRCKNLIMMNRMLEELDLSKLSGHRDNLTLVVN